MFYLKFSKKGHNSSSTKILVIEGINQGETLDSLAAKTRISRNSLFTTIDKVRTILKKELNEDI